MRRRGFLSSLAVLCTTLLTGCGGGDSPAGLSGTITLSLSTSTLSVLQGAIGNLIATIGRTGDFTGAVTVTVEGLPANVTAVATPASLPGGETISTITFAATAGATPGNTAVTIRVRGTGVEDDTATLTLTITSSTASGYGISLNPLTLSIQQGSQATTTATLTRTGGFTGNVTFSHSGAPAGMVVTFLPAATTGTSTAITVALGAAVAVGTHQITIRGAATGMADVTVVLSVTVTTSGSGSSTTFRFCSQPMLFAAYQDGSGPWTVATISNSSFTFNLASGRGGVAYVFSNSATSFTTNIHHGTAAELNSTATSCPTPPATKTVLGSVANLGANEGATVALGTSYGFVFQGGPLTFTLNNVLNAAVDLMAARTVLALSGGSVTSTANKLIVRRNQNPAANSTMPVLDFNAAEAVTPVTRNLTINNLGADVASVTVAFGSQLTSQALTSLPIFSESPGTSAAVRTYPAHPTAGTNDIHAITILAASSGGAIRAHTVYYRDGIDRTVTLGPALGAVTVTTAATVPSARLRAQYTTQAQYNRGWAINYTQTAGGYFRAVNININPAYQGSVTALDTTMPDLSALTGWNALWAFVTGTQVGWGFSAVGGDLTPALDGAVATTTTRQGGITP